MAFPMSELVNEVVSTVDPQHWGGYGSKETALRKEHKCSGCIEFRTQQLLKFT
jgi:hypothetical protein